MEPIKLVISIPFRKDGTPNDYPGCIYAFDAHVISRYIRALSAEISIAAEDTSDFEVMEIEFVNGSVTHLGAEDPARILALVKERFRVSPSARIIFHATPSGLDFYVLSGLKRLGNCILVLDLPTTDEDGLKKAGYHSSREDVLNALDSCAQDTFPPFVCVVSPKYHPTPDHLRQTVIDLLLRHPLAVRFDAALTFEQWSAVKPVFLNSGYSLQDGLWVSEPLPSVGPFHIQIGCGPYSLSVYDSNALRTTEDFEYYCSHSEDYEALVTHSKQENC